MTQKLRCLSVIMPVYNETRTLREIVQRVREVPLPKEIIIVDDGSTDSTQEILSAIQREFDQSGDNHQTTLKVISHHQNRGKGASIRTGISEARGDLLIIQDADLEYNPNDYTKLIEPILSGEVDVVYGSRFQNPNQTPFSWHTWGNKFLTRLSNLFTHLHLTDMETCYKVFRTDMIQRLPIRSNRFAFEPEVTAKLSKLRCRIREVPISYSARGYSEGKKINWKDGLSAVWTIFKYWLVDDLPAGNTATQNT